MRFPRFCLHVILPSSPSSIKIKKEKKISRHELIQRVRRIVGDKLLGAAIKSYRDNKKKPSFLKSRSKNGLATRIE
ncbi:hypothetical protein AAZV13_06G166400 [Glycine max]